MKVLFVITRGDLTGGAQIHVRDLSTRLKRDGHEPSVLTGSRGDFTGQLDAAGVPWSLVPTLKRSISPINDIQAIREIRRNIRRISPDLISTHTAKAGMVGRIAGIREGIPTLFTAHGWQFADGIPHKQAIPVLVIEKILSRFTTRIITVSEYDQRLAIRKKAVSPAKMTVIHNGLPNRPATTKTIGTSPRLLMVARFQAQKDHKTLFYALQRLLGEEWRCELIGDGPDIEESRALAEKLGIGQRVEFLGQRNDVAEKMNEGDIFVLVSHWEGFPRSIVEAMRASLAVVCTDVGGCKESVIHGETGLLVPEGNVEELAEQLKRLIQNPALIRQYGQAGRKRYQQFFTFEHMYERTLEVYRGMLPR